jgi:hypothetical protein
VAVGQIGGSALSEELANPFRWGDDELSEFIETARRNTLATFSNLRPCVQILEGVDLCFRRLTDDVINPAEWDAAFLLLRCHCSHLASVRLAVSGQVAETYMTLRGCLEAALYGLCIARDPGLSDVWTSRHKDEDGKRAVRARFAVGNLRAVLDRESPTLGAAWSLLYERTIDNGAHPNERSIFPNIERVLKEGKIELRLTYLAENSLPLHLAMKTTAQVGIAAIEVFGLLYPVRFTARGLEGMLSPLKRQIDGWVAA